MDQLKVFGKQILKYHFWILSLLVLIVSFVCFIMSRQTLDEQVSTRITAVNGKYTNVSRLSGEAMTHPNDLSDTEMKKSISVLVNDVRAAWETQYNRQRDILVWPKAVGSDSTLRTLDGFRPIESFLEYSATPKEDTYLSKSEREIYRDYVKDVFPELAKIVGAKWTATMSASAAAASTSAYGGSSNYAAPTASSSNTSGNKEIPPLVIWEEASQKTMQGEVIPWYDLANPPTTLEICYTQEDLWVLDGLLRVIKRTNGNARENFQAPIKEIEWIRLGKAARSDAGNVIGAIPSTGTGMPGMNATPIAASTMNDPSATTNAMMLAYGVRGGGGASAVRSDPAEGRYVDSDYKPVPAATLRSAMKSSSPNNALFAVAKRIPVQLRLKMDITKVANLISECGNNDLLIEVKQVRVNGEASAAVSTGGGGGGGGGYGGGGNAGYGPPGGGGAGGGYGSSGPTGGGYGAGGPTGAGLGVSDALKSTDIPIEIYAIVYLYNPVDVQKLGLDKVTATTSLDTTVENATNTVAATNNAANPGNVGGPAATSAAPATDGASPANTVQPVNTAVPTVGSPPTNAVGNTSTTPATALSAPATAPSAPATALSAPATAPIAPATPPEAPSPPVAAETFGE